MDQRTESRVRDWDSQSFSGGYAALHDLADAGFSGVVVTAGDSWLFLLNGRAVGVFQGRIEDFEDADGTVYEAPDPSLPLLFTMLELGGEQRAKYYTEDTPVSEAHETLSDAQFTGFLELSENVLSGDYYVVYYGGRSMSCAFVGSSERLLTGDEAFSQADDEVGIYQVRTVDIDVVDIPEPASGGDDAAAASGAAGGTAETGDATEPSDPGAAAGHSDQGSAAAGSNQGGAAGGADEQPAGGDPTATDPTATDAAEDPARTEGRSAGPAEQDGAGEPGGADEPATGTPDGAAAGGADATGQTGGHGTREATDRSDRTQQGNDAAGQRDTGRDSSRADADPQADARRGTETGSQREPEPTGASQADPNRAESEPARSSETEPGRASEPESDRTSTAESGGAANTEPGSASNAEPGGAPSTDSRPQQPDSGPAQQPGQGSAGSDASATADASSARTSQGTTGRRPTARSAEDFDETERIPSLNPDDTAVAGEAEAASSGGTATAATAASTEADDTSVSSTPSSTSSSTGRTDSPSTASESSSTERRTPEEKTGGAVRSNDPEPDSGADAVDAAVAAENAGELRSKLADREERIEDLEANLADLRVQRDGLREDRDQLRDEVESLEAEIADLENEVETLRSRLNEGTEGRRRLSEEEALTGTNLFVRYDSKSGGTLEDAHAGDVDADEVNENLRLEHHTTFEADNVAVDGQPFGEYLAGSLSRQFVEWAVRTLLYEIRNTGNVKGLSDLYDALPKVDRAELLGEVDVEYTEDGETFSEKRQFDVVLRDRMGDPLVVADINGSRNPATEEMMGSVIENASEVKASNDSLSSAMLVTASFFEPGALEAAAESTGGGGLMGGSSKASFVKLSRKQGYHLLLVETRDESFHVNVPEL